MSTTAPWQASRTAWVRRALIVSVATTGALLSSAIAGAQQPTLTPDEAELFGDEGGGIHAVPVQYVGTVDASGVYVAIADHGDGTVNVYLCDGADVGTWLKGTGSDGTFEATAPDGRTASGTIADGIASGTATLPDGTMVTFTAPAAVPPAGLYERDYFFEGGGGVARTIVLSDGTAKGSTASTSTCADYQTKHDTALKNYREAFTTLQKLSYSRQVVGWKSTAQSAGCAWAATTT